MLEILMNINLKDAAISSNEVAPSMAKANGAIILDRAFTP